MIEDAARCMFRTCAAVSLQLLNPLRNARPSGDSVARQLRGDRQSENECPDELRSVLIFGTPLYYVVAFAPIALIFGSMFFMKNPSPTGSAILYWAIVTFVGLGLGVYFYMASNSISTQTAGGISQSLNYMTIAKAFFITASSLASWKEGSSCRSHISWSSERVRAARRFLVSESSCTLLTVESAAFCASASAFAAILACISARFFACISLTIRGGMLGQQQV